MGKEAAIVILAHDRESYLVWTLRRLVSLQGIEYFHIYVSLDAPDMPNTCDTARRSALARPGVFRRPRRPQPHTGREILIYPPLGIQSVLDAALLGS